jgi:hypothetical protein
MTVPANQVTFPSFRLSPDGTRIACFLLGNGGGATNDLYTVPTDASGASVLVASGVSIDFEITADGARVVYRNHSDELRAAPIGGPGPGVLLASAVDGFELSPDGERAVYLTDEAEPRLFGVVVTGGSAPVELGNGYVDIAAVTIGSASQHVVFRSGTTQLVSVPIGGGAPAVLAAAPPGGSVAAFVLGGGGVFYRVNPPSGSADVFGISVDGTLGPVQLTGPWPGDGMPDGLRVAESGNRVLFVGDQLQDDVLELVSVRFDGGGRLALNPPLVPGGDVSSVFELSPDGSFVAFRADANEDDVHELFLAPVAGGPVTPISGPMTLWGDVRAGPGSFVVGSQRVFYLADQDLDGVVELFAAPR